MKKIFFKSIVFISILFILDTVFYEGFSVLARKVDPLYEKVLRKKPEIVFFGNSQTLYGVVPEVISRETGMSCYNAARYASGMIYAKAIESVILSQYYPKFFIVQVTELYLDRDRVSYIAPYLNNTKVRQSLSYFPYNVRFKYNLCKMLRYNSMLFSYMYRFFTEYDPHDGYMPLYGTSDLEAARTTVPEKVSVHEMEFQEKLLREFIETAERFSIKVIMVAVPYWDSRDDPSVDRCRNIAEAHDIVFLDFSKKEYLTRVLTDDCFYDSAHFNEKGAEIFSSVLGREIARIVKR